MQRWQHRIAPSLGGGFAGTPEQVWGTIPYYDTTAPCVFFGMYGMRDVQAFALHQGEKAILWAGSDIRNLIRGYWLDSTGEERIDVRAICEVFSEYPNYVENMLEKITLGSVGIPSEIVPSFLGNVNDFTPQIQEEKLRYYTSVSGDDFELYGWHELPALAEQHPHIEFHCYGNRSQAPFLEEGLYRGEPAMLKRLPNLFVHGRVSQEQMDAETKTMTGALRLTRFDGFSEILAKSILWGQSPVSPYVLYPGVSDTVGKLLPSARELYLPLLNQYTWNVNK